MATEQTELAEFKLPAKIGKRTPEEVERLTGRKVASLDGFWAGDMLERPVLVKASGIEGEVIAQAAGRPDSKNDWVVVQAWASAGKQFGEPAEFELTDLVPLCVHCWEPLVESEWTGPGTCLNKECFLCGIDGEEGRVY